MEWILSLIAGVIVGHLWTRLRHRAPSLERDTEPHDDWAQRNSEQSEHAEWLLGEFDRPPFSRLLYPDQKEELERYYRLHAVEQAVEPVASEPRQAPAAAVSDHSIAPPISPVSQFPTLTRPASATPEKTTSAALPMAAGPRPAASPLSGAREQPGDAGEPGTSIESQPDTMPAAPMRREMPWRSWSPAELMLYAGAFLIAAAGLLYASVYWSEIGPTPKLGMLMAVTAVFGVLGWFLLGRERLREAGETFVAIAALLLPSNALAVWSISSRSEASTWTILLIGSAFTAVIHGVFSLRPGGVLYRWGCVIASYLAIGALAPAVAAEPLWSIPVVAAAIVVLETIGGRLPAGIVDLTRFARTVGQWAIGPLTLAGALYGLETRAWLGPVTLAICTAGVVLWAQRRSDIQLTALSVVTGLVTILHVYLKVFDTSWTWWTVGLVILAGAALGLAEAGPSAYRQPLIRDILHVASSMVAVAALVPAALTGNGAFALTAATGTGLVVLVGRLREERWWLGGAALLAGLTWLGGLDAMGVEVNATGTRALLVLGVLAVTVSLAAWTTDIWSYRTGRSPRWGLPLWILGSAYTVLAVIAGDIFEQGGDDPGLLLSLGVCLVFGVLLLIAARSSRQRVFRLGYGLWIIAAFGLLVDRGSLAPADTASFLLAGMLAVAAVTLSSWMPAIGRRMPILRERRPGDAYELFIFGSTAAGCLVFILGTTARYLVTVSDDSSLTLPGIRWTWITYLVVYLAIAVGSTLVGSRLGRTSSPSETTLRSLSWTAVGGAALSTILLQRMLTQNLAIWSWVGILLAALLVVGLSVASVYRAANPFLERLAADARVAGMVLGAISVASNLGLAFLSDREVNDWAQVAIYGGAGVIVAGLALRRAETRLVYQGIGGIGLGATFLVRAVDASPEWYTWGYVALSWAALAIAAWVFARDVPVAFRNAWQVATALFGMAAVAFALGQGDLGDYARSWWVMWWAVVSLASTVAGVSWLRQDRGIAIAASALAMLAFGMLVSSHAPDAIQWYTVPLGLYLLALGYQARGDWAIGRAVVGLGAAMMVAPSLVLAIDSEPTANAQIQTGLAALSTVLLLGLAWRLPWPPLTHAAQAALGIGVVFVVRWADADPTWSALGYVLLAWLSLLAGALLTSRRPDSTFSPPWRIAAPVFSVLAIVVAGMHGDLAPDTRAWTFLIWTMVSLAGIVTAESWLRRNPWYGVGSSAIAMLALELSIASHAPGSVQWYMVPLGIYLMALGYQLRATTNARDLALGLGSAVLLGPTFVLALSEQRLTWLMWAIVESLLLFVGGALARLRVPIAAGLLGLTLIVLRTLADVVVGLPGLVTLLVAGLMLLGVGTLMLWQREAIRDRLEGLQRHWNALE